MKRLLRSPAALALAAVALVVAWQAATVQYNYNGDWTALYYTGAWLRLPPALAAERIYTFPNTTGFDGEWYHLVAHDPLMRKGYAAYADNARLRWRRILVPGLARALAAGDDERVDSAYPAVIAIFIGLGVYWSAVFSKRLRLAPAWGLGFLLLPATIVSADRMTVDVALAALCAGFAVYSVTGNRMLLWAVLMLAPLVRETGLALVAGWIAFLAVRRRWREAAWYATAAIPALCWFAYVDEHTHMDATPWLTRVPFGGIARRLLHPIIIDTSTRWLREAAMLDYLAVLGITAAFLVAAWLAWRRQCSPITFAAWAFALTAVFLAKDIWVDAYSFGRTQTPLLFLLALYGMGTRRFWMTAPVLLMLPRLLFQLAVQVKGML